MAITFAPKTDDDVVRRVWHVPVRADDSVATIATATGSGVTVNSSELVGNDVVLFLSAGVAGTPGAVTLSVTTDDGETLDETAYIPILADDAVPSHSETVGSIITYALKPIVGLGGTETSAEQADALEHMNDMLTEWRAVGADVGAVYYTATTQAVYIPDAWVGPVKNNLRVKVAEQYGRQVSPDTYRAARTGLAVIKNDHLKDRDKDRYTKSTTDYQ